VPVNDPDPDLHAPKPLSSLIRREIVGIAGNSVSSMRLRLALLRRASFVDVRARIIKAGDAHIGGHCQIYAGATIRAMGDRWPAISIGRYGIVRENAFVDAHGGWIDLGEGTFVGQNAVIYGQGGVFIGENTMLSPGVIVLSAQHTFDDPALPIKFQPERFEGVSIGSDCWLGANTVVLDGVKIGDCSIVGAGSVVTDDLPQGVVAFGVPARVIRLRPGYDQTTGR
jgi:acetyltransferase-like isoleucine patch superfamily enzyme